MTKKDYIKFAKMLSKFGTSNMIGMSEFKILVEEMSYIFQEDNPSFNRERFFEACGYYD